MKKLLVIAMVAVLALSLAACGKTPADPEVSTSDVSQPAESTPAESEPAEPDSGESEPASEGADVATTVATGVVSEASMHVFKLTVEDGTVLDIMMDDNTVTTLANGLLDDAKVTVTYKTTDEGLMAVEVADAQ